MVRESIARHLGPEAGGAAAVRLKAPFDVAQGGPQALGRPDTTYETGCSSHASHRRLPLVSGDEDGACLIEPAVRCNHCGYCLSLGH
jgi:hypothetical protein